MATQANPLTREIEAWLRGGAYLIGVTGIAAKFPALDFATFWRVLETFPSRGAWSKEAISNAFHRAHKT